MNEWFKDTRTLSFEEILVDFVERMDRHRAGWLAIEIHLSLLRPYNRQPHHLRIVKKTLEPLVKKFSASIYELHNGDLMVLLKGAKIAEVDSCILQVRFLFADDPLFKGDATGPDESEFCTWYQVERDYPALAQRVQRLNEDRKSTIQAAAAEKAPKDSAPSAIAITPKHLEQVEQAIEHADLANLLRRQPVCAVIPGKKPERIFQELYFSMISLAQTVMPGYDVTADAWLFRHLTYVLDRRMLSIAMRRESASMLKGASINLNIGTVLGPSFLEFDKQTNIKDRGTLAIEIPCIEMLHSPGDYMFARDFLKEHGYKIVIDNANRLLLPMIDRDWLGFDFVKIVWSQNLYDDAMGNRGGALQSAVGRIGRDRVILSRVDSELGLKVGEKLGIALYQGRLIDSLLAKT